MSADGDSVEGKTARKPLIGGYSGATALAHVPGFGVEEPIGTPENIVTPDKTKKPSNPQTHKHSPFTPKYTPPAGPSLPLVSFPSKV